MGESITVNKRDFASLFLLRRVDQQTKRILQIGIEEIIHHLPHQTFRNPLQLIVDRLVEFGNIRPLMWNHVPGEFMRFWSFFTSSHLVVFFIAMRILLVRSSSCGMKSGQVCSSTDNLSPIKENKRMFFKLFFSEIYKLSSFVLSNSANYKSIHPFS